MKRIQNLRRRVLALLGCAALSVPLIVGAVPASGESAMPDAQKFTWSSVSGGVSVNGFSKAYTDSLSAEEKQDIAVDIPEKIGDKTVVSIGQSAFSTFNANPGLNFTSLDLTKATGLTRIENYAFYSGKGAAGFRGTLVLPDSVTFLGSNAFSGCSGFTGDLVLPSKLVTMSDSAFMNCSGLKGKLVFPEKTLYSSLPTQAFLYGGFTGALHVPETITSIGKSAFRGCAGFTGTLHISEKVTAILDSAFSGCSGFSALDLPRNLTAIGYHVFMDCTGLTGALDIPDSVVSIGSQALYNTGYETIYLPDNPDTAYESSGSAFNSCSKLTALVASPDTYAGLVKKITATTPKKLLTYPVTVSFDTGAAPVERLYNRPMNLEKGADGAWRANKSYVLPATGLAEETGYTAGWTFTAQGGAARAAATPAALVMGDKLYALQRYADPLVTQGPAYVEKVYDGTPVKLSMTVEHPLLGDKVLFYYQWQRVHGYQYISQNLQWGQTSTYAVTNVADSECGQSGNLYVVLVFAYEKGQTTNYQKIGQYEFQVNIQKATPDITPVCSTTVLLKDGLPALSLPEGAVPGALVWDEGQTLEAGEHVYNWTFTPTDTANYEVVQGTLALNAVDGVRIDASAGEHGSIAPAGNPAVGFGQDMTFTFTPDPGYKVDKVLVDGREAAAAGSYTFRAVSEAHTIQVTFAALTAPDVEDTLVSLPDPSEAATPEERKEAENSILDAKLNLDALSEEEKNAVSSEAADALNDALAKVTGVGVSLEVGEGVPEDAANLLHGNRLLDAMTPEEARALRDGDITKFELVVILDEPHVSAEEQAAFDAKLNGFSVGAPYDVRVEKRITRGGETTSAALNETSRPVTLTFAIPDSLKAPAEVKREFRLLRTHQNADGTYEVTILEDITPENASVVTVETDRFSTYTLVYKDTAASTETTTPPETETTAPVPEKPETPATGETALPLCAAGLLAAVSLAAAAVMRGKKR